MNPGIADVSDTALWIAAYRARETERSGANSRLDTADWSHEPPGAAT
jgi:hypothetical protein